MSEKQYLSGEYGTEKIPGNTNTIALIIKAIGVIIIILSIVLGGYLASDNLYQIFQWNIALYY